MKKRLSQLFILVVTIVAPLFLVTPAYAQGVTPPNGANGSWLNTRCVGSEPGAQDVATIAGVECLVGNVLATVITIIGFVAFVMFLIGGFQYLTAGSNSKGVESGKNSISFAIMGIVVALSSIIILKFISSFTGISTILDFNVPNFNEKGVNQNSSQQ